jgi:nucleoside-diphosphate-sugar epimerase
VSRYLVTGGAGFIGSHLVDALLARGAAVRIVDNFVTGRQANLPAGGSFDLLVGDLAEDGVAARAVEGCEFVLHLAAIPSVPRSVADPLPSHRANVDATLQLLLAARDAGVSRVVFAGSSSVYGDSPTLPKREDQRPGPLSPYALQKLVSEQYCSLFTRLYGLDTVTTRFFNVFGPRQDPGSPYSGVISLFIDAVLEDRRPTIYGDGHQTRDFTYVEDVVTGVLQCCEATGIAGEVLNIAGGGRVSLLEVLDTLADLTDRPIDPIFMPPREGDIRDSQADIARARGLVGFEPSVPFREGLRRTLEWHRQSAVAPPSH